ncbi:MAG TPA: hypothetical protein VMU59_14550 [Caulobacteraceae bacterium]|nr:hypothetical protein [Caulobacteraceae bacterium]
MPAVRGYAKDYVEAARARLDAELSAHAKLRKAAAHSLAESEIQALEQGRLADLLIALDARFTGRGRVAEDGHPFNEVRVLAAAALAADGIVRSVRAVRYDPAKAVLGLKIGEPPVLTAAGVKRLGIAFLDAIEGRRGA